MRRRRSSGILDLLIALPWYVGVAIAAVLFFGAHDLAVYIAQKTSIFGKSPQSIASLLRVGSYIVATAAAFSALRDYSRHKQFVLQQSLDDLRALTWQQFEQVVGETFRRQGYSVTETGQGGADGGVDLELKRAGKRYLVQCKQYRASTVSVIVVREIFGVVAARKADGAIVVTTGTFTPDAVEFSRGQPIKLIDGRQLESMVREIHDGTPGSSKARVEPMVSASSNASLSTVVCPKCGSAMVRRTPRAGGPDFYGCSTFPKCRGIRQI